MNKTVLVPVADGTEELEAVAIIDALRRAGAAVTVASVTGVLQIMARPRLVLEYHGLLAGYQAIFHPGFTPTGSHPERGRVGNGWW